MSIAVWLAVALIGGVGSVARFLVDSAVTRRVARTFSYGTLAVNVSGALLLGFLGGLALGPQAALFAGTAFAGAYTTFSTWMFQTQRLAEQHRYWPAIANIVVSLALGMLAAWLGQWIAGLCRG